MTGILPPRLILFDGICNLCNGAVQFVIRHDKRAAFTFTALQSDAGGEALRRFGLPLADFDSFVYIEGGKAYTRSTGALHVLKDMGGFWKLIYVFIIIPRPVRDYIYDLIARYRYRIFGKKDSCMVPTPELQKRFLS